ELFGVRRVAAGLHTGLSGGAGGQLLLGGGKVLAALGEQFQGDGTGVGGGGNVDGQHEPVGAAEAGGGPGRVGSLGLLARRDQEGQTGQSNDNEGEQKRCCGEPPATARRARHERLLSECVRSVHSNRRGTAGIVV